MSSKNPTLRNSLKSIHKVLQKEGWQGVLKIEGLGFTELSVLRAWAAMNTDATPEVREAISERLQEERRSRPKGKLIYHAVSQRPSANRETVASLRETVLKRLEARMEKSK